MKWRLINRNEPSASGVNLDVETSDLSIWFSSLEGARYDIEMSTTLEPDDWTAVVKDAGGTTGNLATSVSGVSVDPEAQRQFFRVRRSGP